MTLLVTHLMRTLFAMAMTTQPLAATRWVMGCCGVKSTLFLEKIGVSSSSFWLMNCVVPIPAMVTGCVSGQRSEVQSLGSNKIGYIITINFSVIKQNMS